MQTFSCTKKWFLAGLRLSPHSAASPLATNNDIQYIKCVAWCPALEADPTQQLLAVGQANGKVALTNFSKVADPRGIKGKEFSEYCFIGLEGFVNLPGASRLYM